MTNQLIENLKNKVVEDFKKIELKKKEKDEVLNQIAEIERQYKYHGGIFNTDGGYGGVNVSLCQSNYGYSASNSECYDNANIVYNQLEVPRVKLRGINTELIVLEANYQKSLNDYSKAATSLLSPEEQVKSENDLLNSINAISKSPEQTEKNSKLIYWVVGGVGLILLTSLIIIIVKSKKQ